MIKRISCFIVFSLLIIAPQTLLAKELEERKWIEVQTPNFRIRSLLSEEQTVELARHLEMLRVVVSIVTNVNRLDSPVPTEIYALRGGSDSKSFGLSPNLNGYFRTGLRRNTIVVRSGYRVDGAAVMMHEYVHYLIRNNDSLNYPMWFHEGFAEYLSSAQVDLGIVTIGGVPKHRISSFKHSNWLHIRKILSPEGYDGWGNERKAMFYAEAWGLVHYLQNRPDSERPFGQQLGHYVTLIDSGKDAIGAFEEAFAITSRDLDRNVRRYLGGHRIPGFRLRIDDILSNFDAKVSAIPKEEISLALGQTALQLNELDLAEHWFTVAANDDQYQPQAVAGLGDVFKFRGEYDAAEPYFKQAVALSPNDPYCQLDFAEYWHDRAKKSEEKDKQATYLSRAREYYENALSLDDSLPEAYAMYGETFLIDDHDYDLAIQNLERAELLLPSSVTVRVILAEAYLGANRLDDAEKSARSVLAWSHGESDAATRAQEVLDKVAAGRGQDQDLP